MLASVQIVQLKAYGDFTIAVSCLKSATNDGWSIIAGDHLRSLATALASDIDCEFICTEEVGVPALFDARKKGLMAALGSAVTIRAALAKRQSAGHLNFDRVGLRERFLAAGSPTIPLPPAPNIYLAYERILGHLPASLHANANDRPESLGIFPASRIPAKDIPIRLVATLLAAADRAGIRAEIVLLEGERPDLASNGMPCRTIQKSFPSLIGATNAYDLIVSADSLPAHLAEYGATPVFVLTPKANEYWMPRSAFLQTNWAVFDSDILRPSIEHFLRTTA